MEKWCKRNFQNKTIMIDKNIFNKLPNKVKKNEILKKLLLIRAAEFAFVELSKLGKIRGPLHTSVGQEAVAVSVCCNLKKKDSIFSNHRGHGHYLAKDGSLSKLVLELLGLPSGCCGGMGGSMHVAELRKNIIGSNGIVGAGVPLACGYAYADKISKRKSITTVFFGDGAINQGVVMESMNLAAIKNLPILFICENNFYAYSSKSKEMSYKDLFLRAKGFGIESFKLKDHQIEKNFKLIKKLISKIRANSKPIFIEFETYRFDRHFSSERPRFPDYIDYKKEKKMKMLDPCYTYSLKFNLSKAETDRLIADIKSRIVKFGVSRN